MIKVCSVEQAEDSEDGGKEIPAESNHSKFEFQAKDKFRRFLD
jgi:hypothetical protein